MTFKIKDGVAIGTVTVFNSSGVLQVNAPNVSGTVAVANGGTGQTTYTDGQLLIGNTSGNTLTKSTLTAGANVTITNGNGTISIASTDTLPNNGALTLSIGTAAATNTTVTIGNGTGFTANSASASTYDIKVGPALTALATFMNTATAGFIRRTAQDTYTIDTNTYLTSVSFTDTLQTVTGRGATSNVATISLTGATASTTTGTGTLVVTGGVGVSGAINVGGNAAVGGNLSVTGDLTVNGTLTSINSNTISVDDKNFELGSVPSATVSTTGTVGTISGTGPWTATITGMSSTTGLIVGSAIAATAGSGTLFGGGGVAVVASIVSATSITYTVTGGTTPTAGTVTAITTTGATDITADGGGITLKGTTDKTFNWVDATDSWTSSENLAVAAGKTLRVAGSTSGTAIIIAPAAAGAPTLTLPITTGTFALTSDIKDGTLGAAAVSAGATNTTVALNFSAAYSANSTSNVTINPVVGPAITNLATFMNTATAGFIRRTAQDTYTIDTNTYLTSFTEADTLATVTGRGATTATALTLTNATNSTSTTTGALVVTGGVAVQADLVVKGSIVDTTSSGTIIAASTAVQATVAVTSATSVDTWAIATYRSVKYIVQITQGSAYQVSEIMVIHNGTTTTMTEFAVLETGSALGTFTSDISGGNARLLVTMVGATSTTINIQRTLMVI